MAAVAHQTKQVQGMDSLDDHIQERMNDVSMRGAGFYNSNSALQAAAATRCLPLLDINPGSGLAEDKQSHQLFTVVEYGSAQGSNSVAPMKRILDSMPHPCPENHGRGQDRLQVQLVFSDRPQNDFASLAKTISEIPWMEPKAGDTDISEATPSVFPTMVARNFYERVMPTQSVDVGFSFASLHHLNQLPPPAPPATSLEGEQERMVVRKARFREQARHDLEHFLSLRAEELKPGAQLVLSFSSAASSGAPNFAPWALSLWMSILDMVGAGRIPALVSQKFDVPTYDRSLNDVRQTLDAVRHFWSVEQIFEDEIEHPAVEMLLGTKADDDAMRAEYADVTVRWLMAVVSGYFIKALRQGFGEPLDPEQEANLLRDLTDRVRARILRDHSNERLTCWFIYIKLIRI
ncbi:MAG: hypothetical protein M1819_005816 [Sarea resinae]|nr:MAG: hypothetical protein M1819_005816 [Sarea resinae]